MSMMHSQKDIEFRKCILARGVEAKRLKTRSTTMLQFNLG